jgi:glycosyltransferase involved in cell wall biosynthesis
MSEFSVVTIVKGRRKQLANLLQSIEASTLVPFDIQIVCMDNVNEIIIPDGLNASIQPMDNADKLPLAAARNAGIAAAQTDNVIFIDVDCIVSPTLFESMLNYLNQGVIVTAYPLYLPIVPDKGDFAGLRQQAITHPARERIPAGVPVDHLQFWSLIFAVQKHTFNFIGGFDEFFIGYGAEDTDFAMTFHQAGIALFFAQDHVLHQYHAKYDPPVNYFDSILENAGRYKKKWNVLPMQRWLKAFQDMGLIIIDQDDKLNVIKEPSPDQLKKSISKNSY